MGAYTLFRRRDNNSEERRWWLGLGNGEQCSNSVYIFKAEPIVLLIVWM